MYDPHMVMYGTGAFSTTNSPQNDTDVLKIILRNILEYPEFVYTMDIRLTQVPIILTKV